MHARWILFNDTFHYAFYHKAGSKNQVANAFSRQSKLLITMNVELTSFGSLQSQYDYDEDFGTTIWHKCLLKEPTRAYHTQEQFLFHNNQLCILIGSLREYLVKEFHFGGLTAYLGRDKMVVSLASILLAST